MTEMKINGTDIDVYNARLQAYSVSGTALTHNLSAVGNLFRMPTLYSSSFGTRTLTITLTFKQSHQGSDIRGMSVPDKLATAAENITEFETELVGKIVEISLPDGYIYTALATAVPAATFDSSGEHDVTYTFSAIRHKPTVTQRVLSGGFVIYRSNTATPFILNAKFNSVNSDSTVKLQGIHIENVSVGENIIIDSVNALITSDKGNKFNDSDLIEFPLLKPGKNIITSVPTNADITVTYTPTYL